MRMIGTPQEYDFGSAEDERVADPLSDDIDRLLNETAKTNAEAMEEVFHCVPTDRVRSRATAHRLTQHRSRRGRTTSSGCPSRRSRRVTSPCRTWTSTRSSRRSRGVRRHFPPSLTRPVRGSLVPLPKDFLTEVNMVELSAAVNSVTSVSERSRRPC